MKLEIIIAISLLSFLSGCAMMNKKECQAANWYTLGINDGSTGAPMTTFIERHKICTAHGFTVNQTDYLQGRKLGLATYCTPQKGYNAGINGYRYHGVCSAKTEPAFVTAYQKGQRIYEQKNIVNNLKKEIDSLQRSIEQKTDEKNQSEIALITAQTIEKRTQLLLQINRLNQQISNAHADKARLQERHAEAQRTLDRMPRTY